MFCPARSHSQLWWEDTAAGVRNAVEAELVVSSEPPSPQWNVTFQHDPVPQTSLLEREKGVLDLEPEPELVEWVEQE